MDKKIEKWQEEIKKVTLQIISRDGCQGDHIKQICELKKELIFSAAEITRDEMGIIDFQVTQLDSLRRDMLELGWAEDL